MLGAPHDIMINDVKGENRAGDGHTSDRCHAQRQEKKSEIVYIQEMLFISLITPIPFGVNTTGKS